MLKKILSLKPKSSTFFLQLDEEQSNQETSSETAVETQPAQPAATEASAIAPKTEPKPKSKKSQKKSSAIAQQPSVENKPKPVATVDRVEQLIIDAVSAKKDSKVEANSNGSVGNFATDYLISPPAPNRRPGVSLNKFREMTRTMKVNK